MSRNKTRKPPMADSGGSKMANKALDKAKTVRGKRALSPPKKADDPASGVDNVKHKTKKNMSGYTENISG